MLKPPWTDDPAYRFLDATLSLCRLSHEYTQSKKLCSNSSDRERVSVSSTGMFDVSQQHVATGWLKCYTVLGPRATSVTKKKMNASFWKSMKIAVYLCSDVYLDSDATERARDMGWGRRAVKGTLVNNTRTQGTCHVFSLCWFQHLFKISTWLSLVQIQCSNRFCLSNFWGASSLCPCVCSCSTVFL